MDYFSKRQPIALPITVEPSMSEKDDLVAGSDQPPPPRPKKSRFRKALIIVAHLFLLTVLLRFASHKLHRLWHHRHGHHRGPPHFSDPYHAPHVIDMFSEHHEDLHCSSPAEWSDPKEVPPNHHGDPRFSSDASFILPASSESLLFFAHGSYAHGAIHFVEDDTDALYAGSIAVDINVGYWTQEALDQANVCTLSREIGDGIGIFTPHERHRGRRHDELRFNITVRFPKSSEIKKLETILPLFAHHFTKSDIRFNTLSVRSTNFPIISESLVVGSGEVRTSNNIIVGNFTVSDTLEITSANSPIGVNVTMNNANKNNPTKLFVMTSNAPLRSNLSLISTSSDGTEGGFVVETQTSNSPLEVTFPIAPVDSVLHLSAKSSNSPAHVELHPTYEGTFSLKTSVFRPRVDVVENVQDPKGEGRHRNIAFNTVGKELIGSVIWTGGEGDGAEKAGYVEVVTSILPARLRL